MENQLRMNKKSVRIELYEKEKKELLEKAKQFDPPLKLKPYIEYLLRKLLKGELIELKRNKECL